MNYIRFRYTDLGILMLLLYAFFLGLFIRYIPNIINFVLLLFGVLCIVAGNKKINIKQPVISWFAIVCILIVLLNRNARFSNGFFRIDFCIVISLITYILICSSDKWHKSYTSIMFFGGVFYGVTTIFLFLFPDIYMNYVLELFSGNTMNTNIRLIEGGYAVGFSSNFSTTAMYIAVTISIPIVVFLKKDLFDKKVQKGFYFLTIILYVAVLLTGKRAHSLLIIFSGIIAYWYLNREKKIYSLFYVIGGVCTIMVVFYISAQIFPPIYNIVNRFESKMASGDLLSGRGELIRECLTMFEQNPIFGTGWGSYTYHTSSGLIDAHNVYMQLLAENGILLSIPFFGFIICNYLHVVKVAMKADIFVKHNKCKELGILSSALFLQTFFVLYCFTGNPLYDLQIFFPYILSCAIGEYFYRSVNKIGINSTTLADLDIDNLRKVRSRLML